MSGINWGLLQAPNNGMNVLAAFQQGREMRREQDTRNALTTLVQNPNDQAAFGQLAQANAPMAMQWREQRAGQQAQQQKLAAERVKQTGVLLRQVKTDPTRYGQAREAAIALGIPAETIPPAYDPAWVDQQLMMASVFEKDGGQQISGIARELVDAGFQPGTDTFNKAMADVISNKYAAEYVDEYGNTRRRSALSIQPPSVGTQPQSAPQAAAPKIIPQKPAGMTDEQIWAQAHEAVRNGANAEEVFRQLQAWGMNP